MRSLSMNCMVRGFTMRHPQVPEAARGTFGGLNEFKTFVQLLHAAGIEVILDRGL